MPKGYSLEWLDRLVTETLNPEKTGPTILTPDEAAKIQSQIISQKDKVQSVIKCAVFNLNDEVKIKCLIKKYHSCLTTLLEQALKDQALISDSSPLKKMSDTLISCIDELLSLIEGRFTSYLSVDERVPATGLEAVKKELIKQLSVVEKKLRGHETYQPVFKILEQELVTFLTQPYGKHTYIFQEIFYLKELCLELERFEPADGVAVYSGLDELLIHVNFNAHTYISNLKQRLDAHINAAEPGNEQMDRLLYCRKLFEQFPQKQEMIFNSQEVGLHKQLSNWFTQEVFYLEKKIQYLIPPLKRAVVPKEDSKKEKEKISSRLTVDQLSLMLRAADESKILVARSLNSVFKNIAPYLSTPWQENISFDSMRSKSYSAEERDKEVVIKPLQRMIEKINEY